MSLSPSELALAHRLAVDEGLRANVLAKAPITGDLQPLAEAYIGFLRYAPEEVAEMPPAIYAFAAAHRETSSLYAAFRAERPDLARVADFSFERTQQFFSSGYKDTRLICAKYLPELDVTIWPSSARDVFSQTKEGWIMLSTFPIILILLFAAAIVASKAASFALIALAAVGFVTVMTILAKRDRAAKIARLSPSPKVLEAALLTATRKRPGKSGQSSSNSFAGEMIAAVLGGLFTAFSIFS